MRRTLALALTCAGALGCGSSPAGGAAGERTPPPPGPPGWAVAAREDFSAFGDPHVNYYEGEVLYDDVVLELWR